MKRLILLTAVVSAATVFAFAGAQRVCHMVGAPRASADAFEGLGLTEAQKLEVSAIGKRFAAEQGRLCARICEERAKMLDMVGRKAERDAELDAKIDRIGAMQTDLEKSIAAQVIAVKAALGPELSAAYMKRIKSGLQCPVSSAYGAHGPEKAS